MSRFIRLLDPFCIGIPLYLFTQSTIRSNNINNLLDAFSKRSKLISIPYVSVTYVDPTCLSKFCPKLRHYQNHDILQYMIELGHVYYYLNVSGYRVLTDND